MTVILSQQSTEKGSTHTLSYAAVRQLIDYCSRTPSSTTLPPISTQREYFELGLYEIWRINLENSSFNEFFSLIGRDSRNRSPAIAPRIERDLRFGAREC